MLRTYDPVEVALPKLLRAGRRDEALKRVAMTRGAGLPADPMFTLLAADWIKAAIHEPWATVRMARLLAESGDDEASKWLKNAVRRPELAGDAGAGAGRRQGAALPAAEGLVRQRQLDRSPARPPSRWRPRAIRPALAGLTKLLLNTKARPEARAAAAVALGPHRRRRGAEGARGRRQGRQPRRAGARGGDAGADQAGRRAGPR